MPWGPGRCRIQRAARLGRPAEKELTPPGFPIDVGSRRPDATRHVCIVRSPLSLEVNGPSLRRGRITPAGEQRLPRVHLVVSPAPPPGALTYDIIKDGRKVDIGGGQDHAQLFVLGIAADPPVQARIALA